MGDLVKDTDLGFVSQLSNFKDKLPAYQTVLGLDAGVIAAVDNDAGFMAWAVSSIDTSKTYAQGWTNLKNEARDGDGDTPIATFPTPVDVTTPPTAVAPGIEGRFRDLVRQIKANSAYTETMGEDLGIVADSDSTELTAPVLKLELMGGNPTIGFKKSISDGIRIYSRRSGQDEFSFLDVSTKSPYTDSRPNQTPGVAETREYYAYYIKNDEQVGSQSAVASVSVG